MISIDKTAASTTQKKQRAAVILAGGDGNRLRSLTRLIAGDERPKQFCPIVNGRILLDETRDRTALLIKPESTWFSLTASHERYYKRHLWGVHDDKLIVQPENRGTAPAILYALMRLSMSTADATVAFFPSDHFFANDVAFMKYVESALDSVEINPRSVVLIGIEPENAETSYGWIEPADSLFGTLTGSVTRVERFWEKPTAGVAKKLMEKGCLWNSFVMVGKVGAFLQMFREHLPDMYRSFAASVPLLGTPQEKDVIRSIYSWIADTNFSSEVLERSSSSLLVMRAANVGWSDLGEPQRVISALNGLGIQPEWMQAMAA